MTQGAAPPAGAASVEPVPVVFDTDIGTDIDDSWALAFLLASPELDLRLVVTDSGNTTTRARLAAKFLAACGRDDVPVGVGLRSDAPIPMAQAPWLDGFELSDYPGAVHQDGVQAMIDLILESEREVLILAVGPVPNLEEALRREPRIAERAQVVAMSGSIERGYGRSPEPAAEYNVRADPGAAAAMYAAGWDLLIAPLDTAGQVRLEGDLYRRLLEASDPCVEALLENYRIWAAGVDWTRPDPDRESSTLFDVLAVALAFEPELCRVRELSLEVTDEGFTRVRSDGGSRVRAAVGWRTSPRALAELLVERLAGD